MKNILTDDTTLHAEEFIRRLQDKTKIPVNYSYDGKYLIFSAVRSSVGNINREEKQDFARIRCCADCGVWNLYYPKNGGKWEAYQSLWYSKSLEEALNEIEIDRHRCFWNVPT